MGNILAMFCIYSLIGLIWTFMTYIYWNNPVKYNVHLTAVVNIFLWPICVVWVLCDRSFKK